MLSKRLKILIDKISNMQKNCIDDVINEIRINADCYSTYSSSIQKVNKCCIFMIKDAFEKKAVIVDADNWIGFNDFCGSESTAGCYKVKVLSLSHENTCALRKWFPFTAPSCIGKDGMSIGLGDRLGIASPGHLKLVSKTGLKPVIAQQSVREVSLTGRSFRAVLDAASWAVFQENYQAGFGADGDHIKKMEDIKEALDEGFTMITLDCSEWIVDVSGYEDASIEQLYMEMPEDVREQIESIYINRAFTIGDYTIGFNEKSFRRIVLVYIKAIDYVKKVYQELIVPAGRDIDFEVSIDETILATSPEAHFFVASELQRFKIEVNSLAPKFCGEFEKGIDYIGDINQFAQEILVHADIADYFGYKLSIHSGSDKFSVFPYIGHATNGRVHVKTSGTNWLEAVRVIAKHNTELFRQMYICALEKFDEGKKHYHISADISNIPMIETIENEDLESLLDRNDTRQMLHIAYGEILNAKDDKGDYRFRKGIYDVLYQFEEDYYKVLIKHIGKHIDTLTERLN